MKMINTGVKTFVRCDNRNMECAFRLAQEGLGSIVHFIGESRKVKVTKDDLIMLLQNDDHQTPPEITKLSEMVQAQLKDFAKGSCVLVYEEESAADNCSLKLKMVGWRGIMSLRAYVSIHDAIHYLRLLGGDCSKFEKNKFQMIRDGTAKEVKEGDDVSMDVKDKNGDAMAVDEVVDDAVVADDGEVVNDAVVPEDAEVVDDAVVATAAEVTEDAKVTDGAKVTDHAAAAEA